MLKSILLANAASCLAFGALFALFPAATADFVGTPPVWLVIGLGVSLILNGFHLVWVARKDTPATQEILQFVVGDAIWVVATIALIGTGLWITTSQGVWSALGIALWVAGCGLGQYIYRPSAQPA